VDRAARRLGADAFACGSHIYVRGDAFRPGTRAGLRLIAHEAAHPLQSIELGRRVGGNLHVFGIGTDGTLHVTELRPDGWAVWVSNPWGAPRLKSVAAMAGPQNNLEVFGVGKDDRLHHAAQFATSWQNYWTAPFDDAGVPIRSVSLGTDGQGDLNVFVVR
jgi:Domain of unknown function (DUF4157)